MFRMKDVRELMVSKIKCAYCGKCLYAIKIPFMFTLCNVYLQV